MKTIKKKKCYNCSKLFCPDPNNGNCQHFCTEIECRKASKADSQKRWVEKPENQDYFSGIKNVLIITDLGESFYILPKKPISSDYAANFHDNETCSVFQQDFENFDV